MASPGAITKMDWGKNLISKPKNKAKAIFEAGPAMETFKDPHFWSLKLYGLIGTGLAQPKITPLGKRASKIGRITDPKGSKCFNGFRVRRPAYFAVGSPRE